MKYGLRALALASLAALTLMVAACPPAEPNPGASSTPSSTATPAPLTDAQAVAAAKAALAIGYQAGDSASSVTKTLSLAAAGANSVSVAWGTDDPAHVSAAGAVTRPAYGQANVPVVLTATLSRGTATDTKDFNLVVKAISLTSFVVDRDFTSFGALVGPTVTAAAKDGTHIYAGTQSSGLAYSDNSGDDWSFLTTAQGLANDQVKDVLVSGSYVIVATFQGLSVWNRTPGSESITNNFTSNEITDICIGRGRLYAAVKDGANRLMHWTLTDPSITFWGRQDPSFDNINSIYATSTDVFVSGDADATNPEELNVYYGDNVTTATKVDAVAGAAGFVGPVYASGAAIVVGINSQFRYSSDSGASFSDSTPATGSTITGLAPFGSALLSVRYGGDLWYSMDGGATWNGVAVPGHDGPAGILANGVSCEGNLILIPYFGGLVVGHFE